MRTVVALVAIASLVMPRYINASEQDVRNALLTFIEAFESGDTQAMRAAFAEDAVTFPRAIMSTTLEGTLDVAGYRRVQGIDPQMLELVERLKSEKGAPPYLEILPTDLDVRVFGDSALVTFHLGNDRSLGRRTMVFARYDDDWKIVHLHASNVVSADE